MQDIGVPKQERLARFHSQLACLRSWWDICLSTPPAHFPDISFPVVAQLIHAIVSTFRLVILDFPGWDGLAARSVVDITQCLGQLADMVERAHAIAGLECDQGDDIIKKTVKTMRSLKQYFLNLMVEKGGESKGSDDLFMAPGESMPDMMDADFWGSQWLTDMIMSWDNK